MEKYGGMTKNNEIPNWVEHLLLQNEQVVWMHSVGREEQAYDTLFMFLFVMIVIALVCGIIVSGASEVFIFTIGAVLLFGPIVFGANKMTYIATNERIIFREHKPNTTPRSLYYNKIFSIKSTDSNIFVYDKPLNQYDREKGRILTIKNVPKNKKIIKLLKKYWYPKSIYHQYISEVKYIAEMYDLEFDEDFAHDKLVIAVEGKLEGMPLRFNLNNLYYPTNFKIEVECPNPEKNSLLIKPENSSHSLGKLMGMQDIDTKKESFNQQYLLQSNNLTFFHDIVTEKMIDNINQSNRYLRGSFVIDEKRKKKKNPKINSAEILDADMFDFYSDELVQNENHSSILKYEVDNMVSLLNTRLVMEKSLEVFKVMINSALAIKRY